MVRGIARIFASWGTCVAVGNVRQEAAKTTLAAIKEAGGDGFATATNLAENLEDELIKRSQTPEDLGCAMAFPHASRATTRQALNVDGGTVIN